MFTINLAKDTKYLLLKGINAIFAASTYLWVYRFGKLEKLIGDDFGRDNKRWIKANHHNNNNQQKHNNTHQARQAGSERVAKLASR